MSAWDRTLLEPSAKRALDRLITGSPRLARLERAARNEAHFKRLLRRWALETLSDHPEALEYARGQREGAEALTRLRWRDVAAIRLLDYLEHAGAVVFDPNRRGAREIIDPLGVLFRCIRTGSGQATRAFFEDMRHLFAQLSSKEEPAAVTREKLDGWMARHPSGLDPRIVAMRERNRRRILELLVDKISSREIRSRRFHFDRGMKRSEKLHRAEQWWERSDFHVRFAVRSPDLLNEMLGGSLDDATMDRLRDAEAAGIPFFVNPYYLSLLLVEDPDFATAADQAIRDYIIYSRELIEEFGHISAWEREDEVEPGKPNAAGWILPSRRSLHRRYPDVAILIPDSAGRACGGLCASCQRMYDFQSGHLNFEIERLYPSERWPQKLERLLGYYEHDAQLRDILVTGGDALMSTNRTLRGIFDGICRMAARKRDANRARPRGEKFAEMARVRLGTRLPVYLPQRVTPELVQILRDFRERASALGIEQFVIQTHFESAMEVTPEARQAIERLQSAGWVVTNQLVFTAAASRRGHTARLRQVLADVGVLPYYTFTVKGYHENRHVFAPNARSVQEQLEEKAFGRLTTSQEQELLDAVRSPRELTRRLAELRETSGAPFIASDRNVLNLPGVGKSMTFRTIGLTADGRRVLSFDHDSTRNHSPVTEDMGRVTIIESKAVADYLDQLAEIGEDVNEYDTMYGYSIGETEARNAIYEYPARDEAAITRRLTNFALAEEARTA